MLFVASCARRYEGDPALLNTDDGSHQEGANETISAYETVERVADCSMYSTEIESLSMLLFLLL